MGPSPPQSLCLCPWLCDGENQALEDATQSNNVLHLFATSLLLDTFFIEAHVIFRYWRIIFNNQHVKSAADKLEPTSSLRLVNGMRT